MSTYDLMAGLSFVNAGLQNTVQLIEDRKENNPNAWSKFFFNLGGSAARIGVADHMARHGNYWGYTANSFIPFTDTRANAFALGGAPFMLGGYGFGFGMPYAPFGGFGFCGGHHHHHHHHGFYGHHHGSSTYINIRC